jgi:hypothetical protein
MTRLVLPVSTSEKLIKVEASNQGKNGFKLNRKCSIK